MLAHKEVLILFQKKMGCALYALQISYLRMKRLELETVRLAIRESPATYPVYIGCDSRIYAGITVFAIVIAIHDLREGGAVCYAKKLRHQRRMDLYERLLRETELAIHYTMDIRQAIGPRPFEIHLDLNPNKQYRSYQVLATATGWVESLGWQYRIKPECYAADAADHYLS